MQTKIQPDFVTFKETNKAAELSESPTNIKSKSNQEIRRIIRDIPEFKRNIKSFEEQIDMSIDITNYSK